MGAEVVLRREEIGNVVRVFEVEEREREKRD